MHAFRRLITEQMDKRGWRAADLVRAAGLSPQQVSNMLNDDREFLDAMPKRDTMRSLAWAFRIDEGVVFQAAASAYGVPLGNVAPQDVTVLANDVLLGELARRLGVEARMGPGRLAAHDPGKHENRR